MIRPHGRPCGDDAIRSRTAAAPKASAPSPFPTSTERIPMNDRTPAYGVIGAMDVEVALLKEAMGAGTRVTRIAGMEFCEGALGGRPCVVVQCGVGMVNAAACAQELIGRFGVGAVVNTGVGGSLDASIDIGDVVVAADAVNWVMDVANLGYAPGQTPGMDVLAFPADADLRAAAVAAARAEGVVAHEGRVASGDRFVRDAAEKERIAAAFDARCCEMEGVAIAQVCHLNGVPCAIVRAISDKADGSDAVDYPVFEAAAARHCAAIVRRMIAG